MAAPGWSSNKYLANSSEIGPRRWRFACTPAHWRSFIMKRFILSLSTCLRVGMAGPAAAQTTAKDFHDEIEQTTKASQVFRVIMSARDKAIPQRVLDDADCIAVFPQVIKAAFGIGGRGGRGVG